MNSISIIIPVYNAEKYLTECLDSIIAQSYRDFEVILVNDGSRDRSLDICNEFAARDCRIKVIDKPNGGVSSARNCGIKQASGEWITFIDSDDLINKDFLHSLVTAAGEDVDFVMSGLIFFDDSSGLKINEERLPIISKLATDNPEDCFTLATLPLITSPVSKLYRRAIITKHNVAFSEKLSYGEDRDFNLQYIGFCRTASAIDYAGYYYRKGLTDSLSVRRDYLGLLKHDLEYWSKLSEYFAKKHCDDVAVRTYLYGRLFNFYNDRLIQAFKTPGISTPSLSQLREVVNGKKFSQLRRNMNLVTCNALTKAIYKCNSLPVLYFYLKFI